MGSMPQYYSTDNTQSNTESHLLSPSFELNSQPQPYSTMSENSYQPTPDQYGLHSHPSNLGQPPAPMSEPPPYDEFVEYTWPSELTTNLMPPSDTFGSQQLFNSEDQLFFKYFIENLDGDENFMFAPTLPSNMPIYPNSSTDNNDSSSSSSHHLNDYTSTILPGQVNQFNNSSANSTSLSPRTSNITLSSSPPHPPPTPTTNTSSNNNNNINDINDIDDNSSDGGKVDGSSTPTVPSKRKQEGDDRNKRRSSNPRLSPINTKLAMTTTSSSTNISTPTSSSNNNNSNNNNTSIPTSSTTSSSSSSSSRPMSPSIPLSNLSINHNNHNQNNNLNYDDSPDNSPTSSNNNSPSPETPTMDIINTKNEDVDLLTNSSNLDDQNDDIFSPTEIKTEDSITSTTSTSKPTPQKSSRKPYKELLTEEEKRANHIASEQKRRNTIRAGFKELTDIIPTLKNVNNSKSTILFKAVDYIKYLERRNRNLKERAGLLEMRVEMEMRQGKRFHHHHPHPHGNPFGPTTMGFGHQRVAPMPMNYSVMPTAIPLGPSGHHPQQRQPQHVMATPHQIYFVPSNENPNSIMSAGSVVSQSNNIYNRGATMGMQIPQQQQNHHHHPQDNVPGMNIPTMGSDDDGNNGGVDIDGDSSMLGATRVGVKC